MHVHCHKLPALFFRAVLTCVAAAIPSFVVPASAQEAPALAPSTPPENAAMADEPEPSSGKAGPVDVSDAEGDKPGFLASFIDEEDGKVDFSNFLARGGFVPIPIIITEPAVDGGFGLAAAFLTVPPDDPTHVTKTVVGALKTRNGSKGIGAFRSGYAFDGRLNYRIGIARGKITLESFPAFLPKGIEYTNRYKYGIIGSALWSLGGGFSVGPLLDFRKLSSKIDIPGLPERFAIDFNNTLHTGALGLGLHFDNRDNPVTPTRGLNAYVEGKANRGAIGSDRNYEQYDANLFAFQRIAPNLRYGLKLEGEAIRGDYPSYFAPAIDLRGVQAARYQGQNVISSELELTWELSKRWSVLAFGGLGATDAGGRRIYKDSGLIAAGGAGFRYRLARKLGLDAGLDLAYGPGGFTFYIQFGHAWELKMD